MDKEGVGGCNKKLRKLKGRRGRLEGEEEGRERKWER